MNKKTLFAAALAAMVCSTAAHCQAPSGSGGPRGAGGGAMSCPAMILTPPSSNAIEQSAKTLGLEEEQVTLLKTTMAKSEESLATLALKATNAAKALREALMATDYDEQKVKDLAAAAEKTESAMISARIDEWTKIRTIITAEQAAKLQKLTSQRPSQGARPSGPPPGSEGGFQPQGSGGPPPPDAGP